MKPFRKQAMRVTGLYLLFGALWITASDRLLFFFVTDQHLLAEISSIKGFLFVGVTACLLYFLLTLGTDRQEEAPGDEAASPLPQKRTLLLALAGMTMVIPLLGYGAVHLHGRQMEEEAGANLLAAATARAAQIADWLAERRASGKELTIAEGFINRTDLWLRQGGQEEEAKIRNRLENHLLISRLQHIMLLDGEQRPVLGLGTASALPDSLAELAKEAAAQGEVLRGELRRDQAGTLLLDWAVPLFLTGAPPGARAVATVIMSARPDPSFFFSPRDPSRSGAEMLLARRNGDKLLPLAPGAETPEAAEALTCPSPAGTRAAAPEAGTGQASPVLLQCRDHRGEEVLAAVHPVAGSDWLLLARIDRGEVLAHLRSMVFWVSLVAMAVMSAITALLALFWRQQQYAHRLALLAQRAKTDRLLRKFFELPFVGMNITTPGDMRWLQVNDRFCEIVGYSREELAALTWADLTHPEDLAADRAECDKLMQGPSDGYTLEKRFLRKDGQVVHARINVRCVRLDTGEADYFVTTVEDITPSRKAEERLRLNAAAMAATRDAVVITDLTPKILAVNPAFTEMTGYSEAEVLGRNPRILNSGRHHRAFFQEMWAGLLESGFWRGEIWNRRKNGEVYPEWLTISTVRDDQGRPTHYVAVATDISSLKRSEEQIHHLAHYDPLTGLPNRLLLEARLQHTLERAAREENRVAVLVIDLDQFKNINDSLGYTVGDELLQAVTGRLQARLREEDTLARMVGDQFVLVMEIRHPDSEDSRIMAARITAALEAPFTLPGSYEAYVRASIGISLFPQDGGTAGDLLVRADAAMHRAKEQGGSRFCYYTSELNEKALHFLEVEAALRRALDLGELFLHYQPKVDLRSGRISGVEALVRWQRPGIGLVGPLQFVPIAEKCGLIEAIGSWVLEEACRQFRIWREAGLPDIRISVNVSARQFRGDNLERVVRDLLAHYRVPPNRLVLELTESMLMDDPDESVTRLARLKQLGVLLSLDDFGTGYSSLAYLGRFPIDQMKIDRSFVCNIATDPAAATIATAIIALAHRMRLSVVAEGVETEAQLGYLRQNNCDKMQGYLFSRPVPAHELADMLRGNKTLPLADLGRDEATLLLVEDDAPTLAALRRVLAEEGYRIFAAASAAEGLELLAAHPVQVVVSDQRMPGMSGTEFLSRVKILYPNTVRMVLSGHADLETVTRAVNEGALYKFLAKPWDREQLRKEIRDAFQYYESVVAAREM